MSTVRAGRRLGWVFAAALASAGCSGIGMNEGGPTKGAVERRRPNTNMTAEDREAARANMDRVRAKVYQPKLDALRTKLLQSFDAPNADAAKKLAVEAEETGRIAHFNVVLGVLGWKRQFGELEAVDVARIQREFDILSEHDAITALAVAHAAALAANKDAAARTIATRGRAVFPMAPRATEADVANAVASLAGSLATLRDRFLEALHSKTNEEVYARLAPKIQKDFDRYIAMAKEDKEVVLADVHPRSTARAEPGSSTSTPMTAADKKAAATAYGNAILDSTSTIFPILGVVVKGVEATQALLAGDPSKAMDAAVSMIPASGLAKDALAAGANMLKPKAK